MSRYFWFQETAWPFVLMRPMFVSAAEPLSVSAALSLLTMMNWYPWKFPIRKRRYCSFLKTALEREPVLKTLMNRGAAVRVPVVIRSRKRQEASSERKVLQVMKKSWSSQQKVLLSVQRSIVFRSLARLLPVLSSSTSVRILSPELLPSRSLLLQRKKTMKIMRK